MNIPEIGIGRGDGPVYLRLTECRCGYGLVSLVWRFAGVDRPEGLVGEIGRGLRQVPLGAASAVDGKGFLVDGFVLPGSHPRRSAFQVVVTLVQDGRKLHEAVPILGGSGTMGTDEVRFRYPFFLRAGGARPPPPSRAAAASPSATL